MKAEIKSTNLRKERTESDSNRLQYDGNKRTTNY
nr:MAG TPA: hypothetical protein [Caudoviricetes sp.]